MKRLSLARRSARSIEILPLASRTATTYTSTIDCPFWAVGVILTLWTKTAGSSTLKISYEFWDFTLGGWANLNTTGLPTSSVSNNTFVICALGEFTVSNISSNSTAFPLPRRLRAKVTVTDANAIEYQLTGEWIHQ